MLTGARIPAEIGDDRSRLDTARDLKAYAGGAPVTRESGKSRRVSHRRIKRAGHGASAVVAEKWFGGRDRAGVGRVLTYRTRAGARDEPSAPAGTPGGEAAESGTLPGLPTAEQARTELAGLTVAAHGSMRGYSRAKF